MVTSSGGSRLISNQHSRVAGQSIACLLSGAYRRKTDADTPMHVWVNAYLRKQLSYLLLYLDLGKIAVERDTFRNLVAYGKNWI